MPAVTRPDSTQVMQRCGLSHYAEGYATPTDLQAAVEVLIDATEPEVALYLGEELYARTDLSTFKAQAIQNAWMDWTGGNWLKSPFVLKLTGAHEPLLVEDSENFITGMRFLIGMAQDALTLVKAGTTTRPFAMPAVDASTYTRNPGDRSPYQRNLLVDASDGIAADDLEAG